MTSLKFAMQTHEERNRSQGPFSLDALRFVDQHPASCFGFVSRRWPLAFRRLVEDPKQSSSVSECCIDCTIYKKQNRYIHKKGLQKARRTCKYVYKQT